VSETSNETEPCQLRLTGLASFLDTARLGIEIATGRETNEPRSLDVDNFPTPSFQQLVHEFLKGRSTHVINTLPAFQSDPVVQSRVIITYLQVLAARDAARTEKGRESFDLIALRLREAWKEWHGEDSLHDLACGEPPTQHYHFLDRRHSTMTMRSPEHVSAGRWIGVVNSRRDLASTVVDQDAVSTIEDYRDVMAALDRESTELGKAKFRVLAQRQRDHWTRLHGEDKLHEIAFGKPLDIFANVPV
jgi:hypothetical protein